MKLVRTASPRVVYLLAALGLLTGCHTLTTAQETELRDNAAAGDRLLKAWDTKDDATKKAYVYAFTRCCYDARATFDGTPVPAEYVVAPK